MEQFATLKRFVNGHFIFEDENGNEFFRKGSAEEFVFLLQEEIEGMKSLEEIDVRSKMVLTLLYSLEGHKREESEPELIVVSILASEVESDEGTIYCGINPFYTATEYPSQNIFEISRNLFLNLTTEEITEIVSMQGNSRTLTEPYKCDREQGSDIFIIY